MSETPQERGSRQFINYQWRSGRSARGTDLITWSLPYREQIIMDQAMDQRSQFEWYAEANPPANT